MTVLQKTYFSSALFQETTREAHPLNQSKPRKKGSMRQHPTHVSVERISQNESKGHYQEIAVLQAWRAPDGAGDHRLKECCLQGKSETEKNTCCAWKCGKYTEGCFIILFVNLERLSDRYTLIKATKLQLKWDINSRKNKGSICYRKHIYISLLGSEVKPIWS